MRSKKTNPRSPKLASLLKRTLSDYFLTEMDLPGLVSISHIDVAGNMQVATVWLSIYHQDPEDVLQKIVKSSRDIRAYLKENIVSRYIPMLQFRLDPSEEYADTINIKLKNLDD